MDISVSRLTKRMALQLPAQFPLGLVFVVGTVTAPRRASNGDGSETFYLIEDNHRLRCRLSERAIGSVPLEEGYRIRAGGHLAFDPTQADYYLYARDIELIAHEAPRQSSLSAIINDYNQRSEAAGLVPAELPDWVKQMAPEEVQLEWQGTGAKRTATAAAGSVLLNEGYSEARSGILGLGHDVAIAGLSDELLEFLSEAMESEEEVELTPELVAGFSESDEPAPHDESSGSHTQAEVLDGGPQDSVSESRNAASEEETTPGRGPWVTLLIILIILLLAIAGIVLGYTVLGQG